MARQRTLQQIEDVLGVSLTIRNALIGGAMTFGLFGLTYIFTVLVNLIF